VHGPHVPPLPEGEEDRGGGQDRNGRLEELAAGDHRPAPSQSHSLTAAPKTRKWYGTGTPPRAAGWSTETRACWASRENAGSPSRNRSGADTRPPVSRADCRPGSCPC